MTKQPKRIKPNLLLTFEGGLQDNYYTSLLDWGNEYALLATNIGIAIFDPIKILYDNTQLIVAANPKISYIEKRDLTTPNYVALKFK